VELKKWLFERLKAEARGFGIEILEELSSCDRPWGGFLRFSEASFLRFFHAYWQGTEVSGLDKGLRLDPKILLVAPGKRLSLQYHHRRCEHWRVIDGPVKIEIGPDGSSLETFVFDTGEVVQIPCGAWHRLTGLHGWGRIAEIWQSTDPENPSDEDDIVRVEDDFGRVR
jgi:mannose-6-phosphate isomerase-like protein (cupin superfamily)